MGFTKINYDIWERRELYETFRGTTLYTTIHMDISDFLKSVKSKNIRFYPAMIYCISTIVNNHECYKYGYDSKKNIGIWNTLDVMYTVPRKNKTELFSMVVTKYSKEFKEFYKEFLIDYERAENCGVLHCGDTKRDDIIGITAMPDLHFSSCSFGAEEKPDLTPFVILGKYDYRDGRVLMPVCGEFSHAVNDGFHITQFFNELQTMVNDTFIKLCEIF